MNLLDALYLPAAVVTAPWWARKTRSGWAERFGRTIPRPQPLTGRKRVLLHAVSVGEVATLRSLVPMLTGAGVDVVVSVGTDTGLKRAKELYGALPGVSVVRFALDFSPAVRRFLDAVRPDAVALVELEVWPNFIAECERRGVPVCVINGRLSARSFKGYHRLIRFFRPVFSRLAFAAAQDPDYADRFALMGVPRERVLITGSMKWDATPIAEPGVLAPGAETLGAELGIDRSRPLVVAGSTAPLDRSCEEELLSHACPAGGGVQLLCAPRKPEHFDDAFRAMGGSDRCLRRSAIDPSLKGLKGTDRFLLDTIGELRAAYSLADVVFVGRTFGDQGGSDVIEPVSLRKPVLIGPRYANFQYVTNLFRQAGAVEVVETTAELGIRLQSLLNDKDRCRDMVDRGVAVIRAQQGATAKHCELILSLAGVGGGQPGPRREV